MAADPDLTAAQAAANTTAQQLTNPDLTGEQRTHVVEQLRADLANLDRIERGQS